MKQHFTVHERNPGHGIAGRIADIPGTGWAAACHEDFRVMSGYAVDLVDGVPVRICRTEDGLEFRGIMLGLLRLEVDVPLPDAVEAVVDSLPTEVAVFPDYADRQDQPDAPLAQRA